MREDYKKQLSSQIEKHYLDLEQMILEDIVRRIKKPVRLQARQTGRLTGLRLSGILQKTSKK